MAVCLSSDLSSVTAMASPTAACVGVVLLEPVDVPPNPFALSNEDGLLIAGAVGTVWCLAWSIRAVRSVLRDRDNE